jgi:hypothetical protein
MEARMLHEAGCPFQEGNNIGSEILWANCQNVGRGTLSRNKQNDSSFLGDQIQIHLFQSRRFEGLSNRLKQPCNIGS